MAQVDKPQPKQTTPEQHLNGASEAQARAERDAVLHLIGGDEDALRARLDAEGLTGWEWSLLHELEAWDKRLGA